MRTCRKLSGTGCLDDQTLRPAELCDQRKTHSFFSCGKNVGPPSGSLLNSKNYSQVVPNGKSPRCSFVRSFCPCCDHIFVVLAPLEAATAPRSVQPKSYVDKETTQVGGGKGLTVCLCNRSCEGERVTGQLSHNTISTARELNGTE